MSEKLWNGDLHIHTNLSGCAPKTTTADSFLPCIKSEGLEVLGFTNHLYHRDGKSNSGFQHPGVDHVYRLLPELEALKAQTDAKILFGCEAEVIDGQDPTLDPRDAHIFDYVLIGASHIANLAFAYETRYDLSSPDVVRDILIDRFLCACNLGYQVPTSICHPLYPICTDFQSEVVNGISDSTLADCFTLAAKNNINIEIHSCLLETGTPLDSDGISPTYLRVLEAAKACGCRFHFGSDAHSPAQMIGVHSKLIRAAEKLGITRADMWELPALEE